MEKKRLTTAAGAFIGLLILILDGKTALQGARTGIDLCLSVVIPSLFPFFLLSILLTQSLSGFSLSITRCKRIFPGIPTGAESVLIPGFLGGYPAGAQSIGVSYQTGCLKKQDAERMLSFCNNAGPSFLFGMVSGMFEAPGAVWALWGIHVFSALLVGMLLCGGDAGECMPSSSSKVSVTECLNRAIRIMATVCGWVILFRVIIAFFDRWFLWSVPAELRVLLIGLLELSNGCCELKTVADFSLRFLICSVMLSWGGLCVAMQTRSVIGDLTAKPYFRGKLLQTAFATLLSIAFIKHHFLPVFFFILITAAFLQKNQKKGSIRKVIGV